ncbi:unnamed protein product (macronuclear) [Paramecium tetraurelia]|uniref:Uncharacterized protein n=1 Tax=Paramecium tetraurelia TaxID=5888 RepID=A0CPW6_PARTE|nr:uncharacterized protein GSPATT00009225001 [Paramecium tetraurelia]CAK72833.1 unnamed protein product [Paramecium tetraurelia]|eukprot:XP_001440230.1 hypothetical protein (macronuclear) [Paramecium tetraurelia strain d4-2]
MLKKVKQERVEKQSSQLDQQQNKPKLREGASKIDCPIKNSENCELKTNTNIYNLQYQKVMEQIKQIYQEQSTAQANKNNAKVEQGKLKKDKTESKIVSKTRKDQVQEKPVNQVKTNTKQQLEEQKDRIQMNFTQITTNFLNKLKSEFEKVEMDLLALLNN